VYKTAGEVSNDMFGSFHAKGAMPSAGAGTALNSG